jgi:hypothetical protein
MPAVKLERDPARQFSDHDRGDAPARVFAGGAGAAVSVARKVAVDHLSNADGFIGAFAFHGGVDGDLDRAVAEVGGVGEGSGEANFGDREYRRG